MAFPARDKLLSSSVWEMAPRLELNWLVGALAKEERVAEEITSLPADVPAFTLCKNCEMAKTVGSPVADLTTCAISCGTIFPLHGIEVALPRVMLPTLNRQTWLAR